LDDLLDEALKDELIEALEESEKPEEPIVKIEKESCVLPWLGEIEHWRFVLAYSQRADVPSICNVQRRFCVNGVLQGDFTQRACQENVVYEYHTESVISYNQKLSNPFIQPPENAKYRNIPFSSEGKAYETLQVKTARANTNDRYYNESEGIGQNISRKRDCEAPWWEDVKHSHFVKAYKQNKGFSNKLCEVELRLCVDGDLQGTYQYFQCKHYDMPYQDYDRKEEDDERPTVWHLLETLTE